jgi:platelet-activating factor acetylhydrolase
LDLVLDANQGSGDSRIVEFLHHRIDKTRVAVVGHSFGAATAVATGAADARIQAVVALDTWFLPVDVATMTPSQPTLLHQGESWYKWKENYDVTCNMYRQCHAGSRLVTMMGAAHHNYCDMPWISGFALARVGTVGRIDKAVALDLVAKHVLSFLKTHLQMPDHVHEEIEPSEHIMVHDR